MPFNIDPSDVINKIEIRSAVSPPVVFTGAELDRMLKSTDKSESSSILNITKPAIIVSSPYFSYTVAPGGIPGPDEYKWFRFKLFLGSIALVGGIFALGYAAGSKNRKRKINRKLTELNMPTFR